MLKKIIALLVIAVMFGCMFTFTGCASLSFPEKKKYSPEPLPKLKNIKVALVLGGGGAKGLAHVGVIEELEKAGIKPDLIVGCSAGSIVGALYADQVDIKKIKNNLLETKKNALVQYSIVGLPFSLYSNFTFKQYLKKNLTVSDFKALKIPFIAVATELETGRLIPFSRGKIVPTVMASSAYPGAFFPVKIKGHYFIDGGVANPVPVSIAKQLGAKFIIAVDINEKLTTKKPNQLFGLVKRSLEISYIHHSRLAAKGADVVIRMPFKDVGLFNDSFNHYLYRTGVKEARKKIPLILKRIKAKIGNSK